MPIQMQRNVSRNIFNINNEKFYEYMLFPVTTPSDMHMLCRDKWVNDYFAEMWNDVVQIYFKVLP